jgi:uncharacterized membrane protein YsdA (DUF1294 family)
MIVLIAIASVYALMSVITFVAYGIDKRRAERGKRRVPEQTLHVLELLGGWPGAALGQTFFRHKQQKLSYMFVFGVIVLLHVAASIGAGWMGWLF